MLQVYNKKKLQTIEKCHSQQLEVQRIQYEKKLKEIDITF